MALQNIQFNSVNIVENPIELGNKFSDELNIHKIKCKFEEKNQSIVDKELLIWNNSFNIDDLSPSTSNVLIQSTDCYIGLTDNVYDPTIDDFTIETYDITGTLINNSGLIDYDKKFPTTLKYCKFHPEWNNDYSIDGKFSYMDSDTEIIYICVENNTAFDYIYHAKIENGGKFAFSNTIRINSGEFAHLAFKKQRDYNPVYSTAIPNGSISYDLLGDSTVLTSTYYSSNKLSITIDNNKNENIELFATTISNVNSQEMYSKTPLVIISANTTKTLEIKEYDWGFNEYRNVVPATNSSSLSINIPIISSDTVNSFIDMQLEIVYAKTSTASSFDYSIDGGTVNTEITQGIEGFINSVLIEDLDPTIIHNLIINNTVGYPRIVAIEVTRKRKTIYDSLLFSFTDNKILGITDDIDKFSNLDIYPESEKLLSSNQVFTNQNNTWSTSFSQDFVFANNFEEKYPEAQLSVYSNIISGEVYFERIRGSYTDRTDLLNNTMNELIINNDEKGTLIFSGTTIDPIKLTNIRLPYFLKKNINSIEYFDLYIAINGNLNLEDINLNDHIEITSVFKQNQSTFEIQEEEAAQDYPSDDPPEIAEIIMFASNNPPRKFLECDGSEVSITKYENLYDSLANYEIDDGIICALDNSTNTILLNNHGLKNEDVIELSSSGTLPPEFIFVKYFVINATNDDFQISSEINGSVLVFSDNGSGVIKFHTKFKIPDYRGRFIRGFDNGRLLDKNSTTRTNINGIVIGDKINSYQSDSLQSHKHNDSGHNHSVVRYGSIVKWQHNSQHTNFWGTSTQWTGYGYANLGDPVDSGTGAGSPKLSNETRPINKNVQFCIRYES